MDLKTYEKTRYQNIYRHRKNKNFVISISNPKTSISKIGRDKIFDIEKAKEIRENERAKLQKKAEIKYKNNFDELWQKYMNYTIYECKHSYNTYHKKQLHYEKYFKNKLTKALVKYDRDFFVKYINELKTTPKVKNQIIKYLSAFFNWCVFDEKCLIINPLAKFPKYKEQKSEMKYWLPEHLSKIMSTINYDIENGTLKEKETAYRVKMIIVLGFSLGDRIGETRALKYSNINKDLCYIRIKHSINYNTQSEDFLSPTKTRESDEVVYVTQKTINEINNYRAFLNSLSIDTKDDDLILWNYKNKKPYSDTALRVLFNKYITKAGVPKIRMYDLRHTVATTLMSEGYDMYVIQNKLRHKSIRTTIDKYGHITLNKKKEVAEITDKYI